MTVAAPPGQPDLGDRLVAAAVEVFTERGYDRATVAEIARRAGATTGAIYSRYRGKADLLVDALEARLGDEIERLLPDVPEGGAPLLGSLGAHLLDDRQGVDWLLLEAIVASRRDPELALLIRERFDAERDRLAKLVQEGMDAGHIDARLPTTAIAEFGTALGLGMRIHQLLDLIPPSADEWKTVIDMLLAAAAPDSQGANPQ